MDNSNSEIVKDAKAVMAHYSRVQRVEHGALRLRFAGMSQQRKKEVQGRMIGVGVLRVGSGGILELTPAGEAALRKVSGADE